MRIVYTAILIFFSLCSYAQHEKTYTIYFDSDKDEPNKASALSVLINELKSLPITAISISGHTDERGNENYNLTLSEKRAANVASLLKEFFPNATITTTYSGEQRLVTTKEEEQYKNRRVELMVYYAKEEQNPEEVLLQPFSIDVEEQIFPINLDDTIVVIGKEGTTIKISPGSILNKDGKLMKGQAIFLLKEYYNPAKILLAGLNTNSTEGLLQTGDMFRMFIIQGSDTAATKTNKEVQIRLPMKNKELTNMNVYNIPHGADTNLWRNTRSQFREIQSFWDWPKSIELKDLARGRWEYRFETWKVGRRLEEEYEISRPLIKGIRVVPYAKKVKIEIVKTDSVTISVHAKIKYRNKGYRLLRYRRLDTLFSIPYRLPEYDGITSELNFINCDRFIKERNLTDFIVQTPGFKNPNVMLYFKRLNAFMSARTLGSKYVFEQIPANETVYVVAFGKKEDVYYYGQQQYTIERKGTASLTLAQMEQKDFKNKIGELAN